MKSNEMSGRAFRDALRRRRVAWSAFYEQRLRMEMRLFGETWATTSLPRRPKRTEGRPATPGAINGGFFPKRPDMPGQFPSVVIVVKDIQTAMEVDRSAAARCSASRCQFPARSLRLLSRYGRQSRQCCSLTACDDADCATASRSAQCRKWRMPVKTMARPASSAAAITSSSRSDPPGWITAVAPASAAASSPSAKGKKASEATTEPCVSGVSRPAAFAASAALIAAILAEFDAAHLAGADADRGAVLGVDDGVRLHVLGDAEGEDEVGELRFARRALGHDAAVGLR